MLPYSKYAKEENQMDLLVIAVSSWNWITTLYTYKGKE